MDHQQRHNLLVILGPTASGKTRLGVDNTIGSDGKLLPVATYLDPIALPVVIIPTFGIDVRF